MAISAVRRLCIPFLVAAIAVALLALTSGNVNAYPPDGWDRYNQEDGDDLPDQGPPYECDDGLDNDLDGTDLNDPDCTVVGDNELGGAADGTCGDGLDNDLSGTDHADADCIEAAGSPEFQPVFNVKLCNDLDADHTPVGFLDELKGGGGACVEDNSPGGHPDVTSPFTVLHGHMNYAQDYYVTLGGGDVDGSTTIEADESSRLDGSQMAGPNPGGKTGAPAGGLVSTTSLGLANNPCNSTVFPKFVWWEAEWDPSIAVACPPEGTPARWDGMVTDGGDLYPGVADRDSDIVTKFPDCTNEMFDPDGSGDASGGASPVTPRARFAGATQVPPGGDYQMLQSVEFEPGALQAGFSAYAGSLKHPFTKLDVSLGYTNVTVLNDPTTAILQPNPISDFCSVLGTRGSLLGQIDTDDNGSLDTDRVTSATTPGSYMSQARTQSYRDADGDGVENNFDTCAWTANTENPYHTAGVDIDMLDPACDPDINQPAAQFDEDADAYSNSQDWCPQNYNPIPGGPGPGPYPGETEAESTQDYDIAAPDGGPHQDSIGDDCDSENGGSDTVSNGMYFNAIHVDSTCIEGGGVVDGDDDGWCNDLDPDDTDADIPGQMSGAPMDSAAIAVPANTDTDGDGHTNLHEWYMGSDSGNKCAAWDKNDSGGYHQAWPSDMDNNRATNLLDLLVYKPSYNKPQGDPAYNIKVDLDANGTVNLLDLLKFKPNYGTGCVFP